MKTTHPYKVARSGERVASRPSSARTTDRASLYRDHAAKLRATAAKFAALAEATEALAAGYTPEIYIRHRRRLQRITPEQLDTLNERYVGDRGYHAHRDITLHNADGIQIGFVSYNGRCWIGDDNDHVEIPQAGHKTALEHSATGWRD